MVVPVRLESLTYGGTADYNGDMERQYIWFRTGLGFSLAVAGAVASLLGSVLLMFTLPERLWLRLPLTFVVVSAGLAPAFLAERSAISGLARRQTDARLSVD